MLYLVTGKLGSGKTLFAVSMAFRYLNEGRRVVVNFPMDFSSLRQKYPKSFVEVIPDLPTAADLEDLGRGGESEHKAGLLLIDEGARWLNSRDWSGTDRSKIIDWLLHSRKRRWDVVLVIQHHNMLDKQVREGLAEMHVICRRLDRVKMLGFQLPHIHVATTYYGINSGANSPPKAESQWYKPQTWGKCYETTAEFSESRSKYCMLSRWHLVERYRDRLTLRKVLTNVVKGFLLFVLLLSRAFGLFHYRVAPSGVVCFYRYTPTTSQLAAMHASNVRG